MRERVWVLLQLVDVWLLMAAKYTIDFLVEWCSVRQRWLERGLIAGVVLTEVGQQRCFGWPLWVLAGLLCLNYHLWELHRHTDAVRVRRMLNGDFTAGRIGGLCVMGVLLLLMGWAAGGWWLLRLDYGFTLAILYVTAWPINNQHGRRRRAAVAKIVDSFGREYVPEGV